MAEAGTRHPLQANTLFRLTFSMVFTESRCFAQRFQRFLLKIVVLLNVFNGFRRWPKLAPAWVPRPIPAPVSVCCVPGWADTGAGIGRGTRHPLQANTLFRLTFSMVFTESRCFA